MHFFIFQKKKNRSRLLFHSCLLCTHSPNLSQFGRGEDKPRNGETRRKSTRNMHGHTTHEDRQRESSQVFHRFLLWLTLDIRSLLPPPIFYKRKIKTKIFLGRGWKTLWCNRRRKGCFISFYSIPKVKRSRNPIRMQSDSTRLSCSCVSVSSFFSFLLVSIRFLDSLFLLQFPFVSDSKRMELVLWQKEEDWKQFERLIIDARLSRF